MKKNVETIFQYESKTRSFTNLLTSPRIYYYYDTQSKMLMPNSQREMGINQTHSISYMEL